MTIHAGDPFATPEAGRSPVRRLRGRLPAGVTLWTATLDPERPAGLTVSSTIVADGEPGRLLGIVDEESELYHALSGRGRFAVSLLRPADRQLADAFAGLLPVPGGPFRGGSWHSTDFGPVPVGIDTWVGCQLVDARPVGWGMLVEATTDVIHVGDHDSPLIHYRGRYVDGPGWPPHHSG